VGDRLAGEAVTLLDALARVRDLVHSRARNVIVPALDRRYDLRQVPGTQALTSIGGEQCRLQVVQSEVTIRAPVRVLWPRLVLREDLLTTASRLDQFTLRSRHQKTHDFAA
jgi:hypothetical protein